MKHWYTSPHKFAAQNWEHSKLTKNREVLNFLGCWRQSLKICPAPWPFYVHCLRRPKRAEWNQRIQWSNLRWTKQTLRPSFDTNEPETNSKTPIYVLHSHLEWVWESAVGDPDPWNEANIFARIQTDMNSSLLGFPWISSWYWIRGILHAIEPIPKLVRNGAYTCTKSPSPNHHSLLGVVYVTNKVRNPIIPSYNVYSILLIILAKWK